MAKPAKDTEADDNPDLAVKFLGMSAAVENPPQLGDTQTFTVTARCVGEGRDERQSGGYVGYRKMRVLEVEPGDIQKAPPAEKGLFAVPGEDSDDDGTEV